MFPGTPTACNLDLKSSTTALLPPGLSSLCSALPPYCACSLHARHTAPALCTPAVSSCFLGAKRHPPCPQLLRLQLPEHLTHTECPLASDTGIQGLSNQLYVGSVAGGIGVGFPFGSKMETLGATKYSLQLRRSGWRQAVGHSKEPRPDQARPSGGGAGSRAQPGTQRVSQTRSTGKVAKGLQSEGRGPA